MKNIPAVRMFFQKNNNIIPESLPKYDKVVKTHLLMKAVGMKGTTVHHKVSWLCIEENTNASHTAHRFSFGADGYVQQFAEERRDGLPISRSVSAWRVTYGTRYCVPRMVLMAKQCSDSDGPCMPPDFVDGHDIGYWPCADRGQEYNSRLAASKAAKVGGCHYTRAYLHSQLLEDCLIVASKGREMR